MRISTELGSGVAGITGKEGTEDQWRKLYEAAGLKISKITSLQDNFGTSIVEGVKHRWPISGVPTFSFHRARSFRARPVHLGPITQCL